MMTGYMCFYHTALSRERASFCQRAINNTNLDLSDFFDKLSDDARALCQIHPLVGQASGEGSALRLPKSGCLSTLVGESHPLNLEGGLDLTLHFDFSKS